MKRIMAKEEKFVKKDAPSNSDVSPEQERKGALNWWKFLNIVLFVVIVLVGFVLHCVNSRKHEAEQMVLKYEAEIETLSKDLNSCHGNVTQQKSVNKELRAKLHKQEEEAKRLQNINRNCERQKEELQRQKKELQERISRLEKENADLEDITEKADIRLSKMIAERALDRNDGVSKLEENSPMKLAEKFRDIYDNEYTDAFEELERKYGDKRTKKLTKQLLDILEMANNLCINYSTHHQKSIEQSASSLQVLVPPSRVTLKYSKNTTTYVSDGISLRRHWKETFCIRRSCPKGKQKQIVEENPGSEEPVESPENTTTYVSDGISLRRHWKETFCIRGTCPKGKQKQIVEENPGSEEPVESSEDKVNVTVVEEKLSDRELKQIYAIRTTVAYRIQDRLIKVLLQVIVNTFDFDMDSQPFLIKYIRKCLSLCWIMNIHSNPVFIKFVKASKSTKFDTKAFEPFLTSGKYLDYVVWPPLYLHEGGHMLGKGFAEGRN